MPHVAARAHAGLQVGKTTLARWLLPRATYVTLDDSADADRGRLSPDQFLRTLRQPAILDEIQYALELLGQLKLAVDRDRRAGRFLVTGSQPLSLMAPKLYFADTGLLCFLQGFRRPQDVTAHALWGAVWENLVVSEVRKRVLATGRPPPHWFWRIAHGDDVERSDPPTGARQLR